MNAITRETIEHALEHERGRLSRWKEDIDRRRGDISRLERERDEIVDRIGALKETLASETTHANYKWYTDAPHRAFA